MHVFVCRSLGSQDCKVSQDVRLGEEYRSQDVKALQFINYYPQIIAWCPNNRRILIYTILLEGGGDMPIIRPFSVKSISVFFLNITPK
jgi:hypothetical protein